MVDTPHFVFVKDAWLIASNPHSAPFVLILRSANWKVHAEDAKESFSCVSGKIVRDNLSCFFVLGFNAYFFRKKQQFRGSWFHFLA